MYKYARCFAKKSRKWIKKMTSQNARYQEKERGCGISLDNSWRISVVMQAHNSCCATGDTDYLNNIS